MKAKYIKYKYTENFSFGLRMKKLPRGVTLKIGFDDQHEFERNNIGESLKEKYPDFLIGIHTVEKEINISRLITDEEIKENIIFFTQCAQDYDMLASSLINLLIMKLGLDLNWDFPRLTFNKLRNTWIGKRKVNGWEYNIHGFHCRFTNIKSGQVIEASLACGNQFGELDPYFFSNYILSTAKYKPLPVKIDHGYHDGVRILNTMERLGKLKLIETNWENRYGYVLVEKETSNIRPFIPSNVQLEPNTKFNLLRFSK